MSSPGDTNIRSEPSGRASNGVLPEAPPAGLNPADVYYTLFRHKWLILSGFVLGVVAAGYLYFTKQALYSSEARLLVRYVRETKSMDATANAGQVTSPDSRGENLLNTEIEIITSFDLVTEVAELVGPEKIRPGVPGGTSPAEAAVAILKVLVVEVPRKSNAIRILYQHADPETAQAVVRQLITCYKRKHAEVHRALGVADEFLTKQTDEMRTRLSQTEEELRTLKARAGVILVEDAKKEILAQRTKIQQDLIAAESELAERRTILEQLRVTAGISAKSTNSPSDTNPAPAKVEAPVDPGTVARYRDVSGRIESLRTRELDLLSQFGDENALVRDTRTRMRDLEKIKRELEQANPRLIAMPVPVYQSPRVDSDARRPALDLDSVASNVAALEARIRYLNTQMDKVRQEAAALDANESRINELERKRALEEANYRYFAANLEQARVDQALGAGNLPNISILQEASPPFREARQMLKLVGKAIGGGVGAGLGLAFLLEFLLDRTIRKPSQVASQLRLPLFLTVPALRLNRSSRKTRSRAPVSLISGSGGPAPEETEIESDPATLALATDPLALYHEALRDRLVMYFEINGLTHRPKLVGVTGATGGVGTTTLAAGLAASLSETGEGNVLLVDMNLANGAAVHPFYRGKAMCGLTEALEQDTRGHARVQENLYVVTARRGNGHQVGILPRRFAHIVPRLQAADYDYIIFDLPSVSQTSVTPKLAGLLDMTLLVLESEKTKQDSAAHAMALLAESKAKVAAVLNKHRPYLPRYLQVEN